MELGCTLKLKQDVDNGYSPPHRVSEITLDVGMERSGKWGLVESSDDSRIDVAATKGLWFVHYSEEDDLSTLYIARTSDKRILFELPGVNHRALTEVGCGRGFGGDGVHRGPPLTAVRFSIWYGCA